MAFNRYCLKVTLENWIFLRNGYLIDTVYCLKVTLEYWIFLRNGYLIDTTRVLDFLRNGLKVTLENRILENGYLIDISDL